MVVVFFDDVCEEQQKNTNIIIGVEKKIYTKSVMKNGTKIKTRARVSLDKDDNNNIIHAGRSGRDLRLSNRNATTGKPFETASGVHTLSRENNQYAPRPRRINRVRRKSYSNGVTHKRSYGDDGRTRTDLFDSTARSNTICRVPRC